MSSAVMFRKQYGPPWGTHHDADRRVNVAELLRVSLFTQQGRVSFSGTLLTMLRIVAGLDGIWHGRLRVSSSVFTWQDSLRKGFAEDLGLVLSTVAAADLGWDGNGLHWADLQRQYWGSSNNRPDLIFSVAGGQIVGESKCAVRQTNAVVHPPSAEHLEWIGELEEWAVDVPIKWFLAATWATPTGVVVDVFDPGEPAALVPPELVELATAERERSLHNTAPTDTAIVRGNRTLRGAWLSLPRVGDNEDPPTSLFLGSLRPPLVEPLQADSDDVLVSAASGVVVILTTSRRAASLPAIEDAWDLLFADDEADVLTLSRAAANVEARAVLRSDGRMTVLAGSTAVRLAKASFPTTAQLLRDRLVQEGTLRPDDRRRLRFESSFVFDTPSQAAQQVVGTAISGWRAWRFPDGSTLGRRHVRH